MHYSTCEVLRLVLCLGLLACDRPVATQVLVRVDAEENVRLATNALRLRVTGASGETYRLTRAEFVWPATLPVEPAGGDASRRVTVHAEALDAAGAIVTSTRARFGFIQGARLEVRLLLESACGSVTCSSEETCFAGSCRPVCVEPSVEGAIDRSTPIPCNEALDAGIADAGADCACGPCATCGADGGCVSVPDGTSCESGACITGSCCTGCVDAAGACLAGTEPTACGTGGDRCAACECGGDTCSDGCRPAVALDNVSSYYGHGCASSGERVYCWGRDTSGQIGLGAGDQSTPAPVLVADMLGRVDASSDYTCAVDGAGTARCWGKNDSGQAGQPATSAVESPSPIAGTWESLAIGPGMFTCGIRTDVAGVWCFGDNTSGELGIGVTGGIRTMPQRVGVGWVELALGGNHALARTAEGRLFAWGSNATRQLGTDATELASEPIVVETEFLDWVALDAGGEHSCGIRSEARELWCWGSNNNGQLGIGTLRDGPYARAVFVRGPIRAVSAGEAHTCAIDGADRLWCWGSNRTAQIGTGETGGDEPEPFFLDAVGRVSSVYAGGSHTCAVTRTGALYCWGRQDDGRLGNGSAAVGSVPLPARICIPP